MHALSRSKHLSLDTNEACETYLGKKLEYESVGAPITGQKSITDEEALIGGLESYPSHADKPRLSEAKRAFICKPRPRWFA